MSVRSRRVSGAGDLRSATDFLATTSRAFDRRPLESSTIQMTASPTNGDSCLIVEVPAQDAGDVPSTLAPNFEAIRTALRTKLVGGKEFVPGGNVMNHPVHVTVIGDGTAAWAIASRVEFTDVVYRRTKIVPSCKVMTAWPSTECKVATAR